MSETLKILIEQLHHPDKNMRSRAALSLGDFDNANALKALLQSLCTESDLYVREDMTWAIVRKGEAALSPLIDLLLHDANPSARHHAAHVLSKIADAGAVNALISALHDTHIPVVMKAAFALGQIGDVRAIAPLVRLLGHEDDQLQATLASVLERFDAAAVPALIEAARHEQWQVREQAADILGLIGDAEAISILMTALDDAHWQVRFAAVTSLGRLGGESARNALQPIQNDLISEFGT